LSEELKYSLKTLRSGTIAAVLITLILIMIPVGAGFCTSAMTLTQTTYVATHTSVIQEYQRGCTMIVVGKNATIDGSIILARNEDYLGNWAKHVIIVPRQYHKEGEYICGATGFCFKLPKVTYKYVAMEDWNPALGRYHEAGINEYYLAVTATVTASQNEKAREADPPVPNGIAEDIITTIVLMTAKNAREAVKLVGDLVETYGSAEIFAMAVADPNEAWIIEVVGGHHWVAVKVPDNSYVVYGNALRICEVNLSDTENYMGSKDLIDFAIKHGLWSPESGEPFCVAKAYGAPRHPRNYRRVWGVAHLFSPSANYDPEQKWYPYSMKPDKKLSIKDIMKALRYHYQGTPYDSDTNPKERPIGVPYTIESHVIQVRSWLPVEIGGVIWIAMSAARAGVYVPFYAGITELPYTYTIGSNEYDPVSAFWTFRVLANILFTDPKRWEPIIRSYLDPYEDKLIDAQSEIDSLALTLYHINKTLAIEFLNDYCKNVALGAQELARNVFAELMTTMAGRE